MKIVIIIISLIAVLLFILFSISQTQLNVSKARIVQLENIKSVQTERLNNQTTVTQTTQPKTLDQETFEFAVSTNLAMQTYIETLQQIMDKNNVEYPKFIYQEILEME